MLLVRPFSVRVTGHSSAPCPTLVCRQRRDTIVSEVHQIVERMSGLSSGWGARLLQAQATAVKASGSHSSLRGASSPRTMSDENGPLDPSLCQEAAPFGELACLRVGRGSLLGGWLGLDRTSVEGGGRRGRG